MIAPAVYGGVLRRILAYVDPMELEARGLSPMDVVRTLQNQSVFIPTGNAKFGDIDANHPYDTEVYREENRYVFVGAGPFQLYTEVELNKKTGEITRKAVEID